MTRSAPIRYREIGGAPPPARFFHALAERPGAFLLDSAMPGPGGGGSVVPSRWSFFGSDPCAVLSAGGRPGDDPLRALAGFLGEAGIGSEAEAPDGPAPFAGGAVGFFGYDLKHRLEPIPEPAAPRKTDDLRLALYPAVGAWDHRERRLWLLGRDFPASEGGAGAALDALQRRVEAACRPEHPATAASSSGASRGPAEDGGGGERPDGPSGPFGEGWRARSTREEYLEAVRAVKGHIERGDIYQANLTQRFDAAGPRPPQAGDAGGVRTGGAAAAGDSWNAYVRLRESSPAPFAAFARCGDLEILSASPERFLRRDGDRIETRPIKGTRPRGKTPEEDARLARELLDSAKDVAELVMIIDVERNDLGRVCRAGSVVVPDLMRLESYATVHHLVSTVEGRLRPRTGFVEILAATFPGGSITGAPKIRAMEILDGLEPVRRGPYTGAFGWIDGSGAFDLQIAIRTAYRRGGRTWFQVGGGITTASDPESEYVETLDKGRALAAALAPLAGRGSGA